MENYELDIYKKIKKNNIETTKGRIIFNDCLPKGYQEKYGFVNEAVNKSKIKEILTNVYVSFPNEFFNTINKLQKISNFYMTVFNKSILFDDFDLPDDLKKEKNELKKIDDIDEFYKKSKELTNKIKDYLKKNDKQLYHLIESGASKGRLEPLIVSKGVVSKFNSEPFITKSSIYDGLNSEEFFNSGYSARSGLADRVINTSHTGYLARKLVYAMSSLFFDEKVNDCHTKRTFTLLYNKDMKNKILGRYYVDEKNNIKKITSENIKLFSDGDKINLRSPIYCLSEGICKTCLGDIYKKLDSKNIGIIAAQVLGERGTQSIMKSFHTGGALNLKSIDSFKYILRLNQDVTKNQLSRYIKQDNNYLISLQPLVINIDKDKIYEINKEEKKIIFNDSTEFNIVFENELNLFVSFDIGSNIIYDNLNEDNNNYYIYFDKNKNIINLNSFVSNVDFKYMRRIFEQTLQSKDEYDLFYKIFDIYNELGSVDNIHIELIVSEMCRNPDYEYERYRHMKNIDTKKPLIVSIKNLPYISSPELGLYFENPQKAIENSLIFEEDNERKSSIGQLLEY